MRFDIEAIKDNLDCRRLVEADLGPPMRHAAGYAAWKCPFHQEKHGSSLVVYADHWRCFGKCNVSGDSVAWLMNFRKMSFRHACSVLVQEDGSASLVSPTRMHPTNGDSALSEPPDSDWQQHAQKVVEYGEQQLWNDVGRRARHYLTSQRQLSPKMLKQARVGFIPGHFEQWKAVLPRWCYHDSAKERVIKVPCGILIPHFADGAIWALRVRRAAVTPKNSKYEAVRGGRKALYWADAIHPLHPILIVEGEFDCLAVAQCADDLVSPVAIASAANRYINRRWWLKLIGAPRIFVRMDADSAGQQAAAALQQLSQRVRSVDIVEHKDVNELLCAQGRDGVRQWVFNFLKEPKSMEEIT